LFYKARANESIKRTRAIAVPIIVGVPTPASGSDGCALGDDWAVPPPVAVAVAVGVAVGPPVPVAVGVGVAVGLPEPVAVAVAVGVAVGLPVPVGVGVGSVNMGKFNVHAVLGFI